VRLWWLGAEKIVGSLDKIGEAFTESVLYNR
jgi:hypothetical protein